MTYVFPNSAFLIFFLITTFFPSNCYKGCHIHLPAGMHSSAWVSFRSWKNILPKLAFFLGGISCCLCWIRVLSYLWFICICIYVCVCVYTHFYLLGVVPRGLCFVSFCCELGRRNMSRMSLDFWNFLMLLKNYSQYILMWTYSGNLVLSLPLPSTVDVPRKDTAAPWASAGTYWSWSIEIPSLWFRVLRWFEDC